MGKERHTKSESFSGVLQKENAILIIFIKTSSVKYVHFFLIKYISPRWGFSPRGIIKFL